MRFPVRVKSVLRAGVPVYSLESILALQVHPYLKRSSRASGNSSKGLVPLSGDNLSEAK